MGAEPKAVLPQQHSRRRQGSLRDTHTYTVCRCNTPKLKWPSVPEPNGSGKQAQHEGKPSRGRMLSSIWPDCGAQVCRVHKRRCSLAQQSCRITSTLLRALLLLLPPLLNPANIYCYSRHSMTALVCFQHRGTKGTGAVSRRFPALRDTRASHW